MPIFPIANFQNKSKLRAANGGLWFSNNPRNATKRSISTALVIAVLLIMSVSATVLAHPLGNFTINRYSKLRLATEQIELLYVLDIAEIPTYRIRTQMDSDGNGEISPAEQQQYLDAEKTKLATNFDLRLNGQLTVLQNESIALEFIEGQAGLPTTRIEARYVTAGQFNPQSTQLDYHDNNFPEQLGWQEVVIEAQSGVAIENSSVPGSDISDELRNYPTDLLSNPPATSVASATIRLGNGVADGSAVQQAAVQSQVAGTTAIGKPGDGFADLINTTALTPWAIFLALLAAFGWGAAHAMSPGHGKTIVGAYLVGTRGTVNHAIFLGLTTTITHTAGVFALGFVTLFLSNFILPETLYPWLGVLSGLTIVVLGLTMSWSRLKGALGLQGHSHLHEHIHDHAHDHPHHHHAHEHHEHDHGHAFYHDHGDGHVHSHLPPIEPDAVTWRNLLALGVSGGLIPCPSALVLMLGAISLHRVGLGLLLIFIFSLGLASVLSGIGILLVKARSFFDRVAVEGRAIRFLPVASALLITIVGIGITWQALISTGVLTPQSLQIAQLF